MMHADNVPHLITGMTTERVVA